jgi:F-type H+-transporting ATPase subunit gamma
MPSLLDLRRRIRAVKSTQQITKAMKMIAASRLRRSQDRILGARPFANQMRRVLNDLASRVDSHAHPLLALPEDKPGVPTLYVVITADRGLCGSFNTNIAREAGTLLVKQPREEVALALIGRKGRDFFRRRGYDVRYEHVNLFANLKYTDAQAIAQVAIEDFSSGAIDGVNLIYNEFKSVIQQRVVVERLLPIPRFGDTGVILGERGGRGPAGLELVEPTGPDYLYEPSPAEIFKTLLPRHVEVQIYRALLESAAAENAARMTAMDAASKNAAEMIDGLTLYMNKVRQAAITREIIEVVSGAQAL